MSKRRHEEHEEHENHERWLVSYADMMTLLFALFVVLFAISSLNKSKIDAFASSMVKNKAIGQPMITTPNPIKDPIEPKPGQPVTRAQLEKLKEELEKALARAGVSKGAKIEIDAKGLEISLTDGVLYNSGEAILLPNGVKILDVVGPRMRTFDNPVTVEGHTDNAPISSDRYADNWELSSARANTVVRFFLGKYHLDPDRLTSSGFADTRPVVPNDSDEHRATNRRVVVTISAPAAAGAAADVAGTGGAGTKSGH
ncbi:MAG: chemotaxis protein MotB [Frankiaceae bacterium]|jgi:chemotaxis protein MotB|nr:chemotaxis protein MotB [Frankiaceae bacterium]MDQ1636580.1 chemotaxis protein MotB [Frankiaceae bacterium]MDQ1648651.1 chemotaxis protein MotB [Frankiaceae bacterium]